MSQFLILPYDEPGQFDDLSPQQMQSIIQRYMEWTERLAEKGHLRLGHKLKDGEGRILNGAGAAMTVIDGPFSETKEILGGLWIIEADDYDSAVQLVSDCPHLEHGTLAIRAIDEH